jgi:hypothetical protein
MSTTHHHGPASYPRTAAWIGIVLVVALLAYTTALSTIAAVAILVVAGVLILLTKGAHR